MLNKRRVIMMLGAFVLGLIFCSFATAEVFSSYQAARAATVKNKKPLVVLITASWCPPCKAFKKNILPGLYSSDAFKNVNFVHMDVDMDPMARQILKRRGLPSMIKYTPGKRWKTESITGYQTIEKIKTFLGEKNEVQKSIPQYDGPNPQPTSPFRIRQRSVRVQSSGSQSGNRSQQYQSGWQCPSR